MFLFLITIHIKAQENPLVDQLLDRIEQISTERDSLKRVNVKQQETISSNKKKADTTLKGLHIKIDQLQTQVQDEDKLKNTIKKLTDSITGILVEKENESKSLQSLFDNLKVKYNSILIDRQEEEHKRVVSFEEKLRQKNDSITELKNSIVNRDNIIKDNKSKTEAIANKKYIEGQKKGQQEVFDKFKANYSSGSFDDLIISSTKKVVIRDLQFAQKNDPKTYMMLKELSLYFAAKEVLEQPYNEQQVKKALDQLSQITATSVKLDRLKKAISQYKLCNDALKKAIEKILGDIDKKFRASDDDESQVKKLKQVLAILSWYFRNYRFDFKEYSYLSDVVLELMNSKQRDANANINHLLDKL
ncbi:hypothetical protein GCM10022397_06170 [Flavivirga jejuensis]